MRLNFLFKICNQAKRDEVHLWIQSFWILQIKQIFLSLFANNIQSKKDAETKLFIQDTPK